MEKTFYCNRCLKDCDYEPYGSFRNAYKQLIVCKQCLDFLVKIDEKLGEGYINYRPEHSKREDTHPCITCGCTCSYYE